MNKYTKAALKLHSHIVNKHWNEKAIVGPDPVGKIHWRVTRFIRSYLTWLPKDDRYIYLQGQAYWIKGNLALYELTGNSQYLEFADQCADYIVQSQPTDGAWLHPPIWGRRGFISTVEGVWASLGLAAAYRKIGKQAHLDAALKWYDFQINNIGFEKVRDSMAANYYSHSSSLVPNVTTMLIWLTAELYQITGDKLYLEYTDKMLRFIKYSQLESGELPYALPTQIHFMCYQYNSFQFLDLAHYYQLTGNQETLQILTKLAQFLSLGVTERGSCRYNCFKENPETNYWTAAIAAALHRAHQLGLGQYQELCERSYQRLLSRQNPDGGFDFSDKNYYILSDRRSYPRQQAMILNFILGKSEEN